MFSSANIPFYISIKGACAIIRSAIPKSTTAIIPIGNSTFSNPFAKPALYFSGCHLAILIPIIKPAKNTSVPIKYANGLRNMPSTIETGTAKKAILIGCGSFFFLRALYFLGLCFLLNKCNYLPPFQSY